MTEYETNQDCAHCNRPATHKHALTGVYLCCGHASWDIDAKPIRDGHECVDFYTIERHTRELECEHRDNPNPPTGDLVPCHETAEWEVTASKFPGNTVDPDHPGAPTCSMYCDEHFADDIRWIINNSAYDQLEVRPRDWGFVDVEADQDTPD